MQLMINGELFEVEVPDEERLLWLIRDYAGLTGTKYGCGVGICGACTVHVDGEAVRSCTMPANSADGANVTTIEGLATSDVDGNEVLHPIQQAFIDAQVPQCSWCMSGQMMTAAAFLETNADPTEDEIIEAMNNNYCRCGCYARVKTGVALAAELMQETEA